MKLFTVGKVGCFCDAITHSLEKRRGEEVKVVSLTLRVAPFDVKLAGTLPDGVRTTLFNLNAGEPKALLRRVEFALGMDRQRCHVFAAPDTDQASIMLDQARIHATYARNQKDQNGFDFLFKATFGPVGRRELEFVQEWLLTQKFCSFEESEPLLETEAEDDEDEAETVTERPKPMRDEKDQPAPAAAAPEGEPANRKLHQHKPRSKGNGKAAEGARA